MPNVDVETAKESKVEVDVADDGDNVNGDVNGDLNKPRRGRGRGGGGGGANRTPRGAAASGGRGRDFDGRGGRKYRPQRDRRSRDAKDNGEKALNGDDGREVYKKERPVKSDKDPNDEAAEVDGDRTEDGERRYRGRGRARGRGRGRGDRRRYNNSNSENTAGDDRQSSTRFFRRSQLSHFLSIPLNTTEIQEKFNELRQDIIDKFGDNDEMFIGEDLFQTPAKIHITLGVMNLKDKDQEAAAVEHLKSCVEDIVKPEIAKSGPLNLKLFGVETLENRFNPKRRPRVLYAKVTEGADRLQVIADKIVDSFVEKGIMEREHDNVRLHVTLMNVSFRERVHKRQPEHWKLPKPNYKFESRPLVEKYSDFLFVESNPVNSIHLSKFRGVGDDGYYEPELVAQFD